MKVTGIITEINGDYDDKDNLIDSVESHDLLNPDNLGEFIRNLGYLGTLAKDYRLEIEQCDGNPGIVDFRDQSGVVRFHVTIRFDN